MVCPPVEHLPYQVLSSCLLLCLKNLYLNTGSTPQKRDRITTPAVAAVVVADVIFVVVVVVVALALAVVVVVAAAIVVSMAAAVMVRELWKTTLMQRCLTNERRRRFELVTGDVP